MVVCDDLLISSRKKSWKLQTTKKKKSSPHSRLGTRGGGTEWLEIFRVPFSEQVASPNPHHILQNTTSGTTSMIILLL